MTIETLIKTELEKNTEALAIYNALSASHKKAYVEWIESAKKEVTKLNRLKKVSDILIEKNKENECLSDRCRFWNKTDRL